jgi:hypothetical protein
VLDHEGGEWAFLYSNATKEIISFLGPGAPEIADWAKGQAVHPVCFRLSGVRR